MRKRQIGHLENEFLYCGMDAANTHAFLKNETLARSRK